MRALLRSILTVLGASAAIAAASPEPTPIGNWLTEKKDGIVEIIRCSGGETLCGRLVWFRIKAEDSNQQGLDVNNPDPARRNQPLCGLTFMYGFKPAGPSNWESGTVYDPDSGNTYNVTLKLRADGTLDLHGYIGISLIGRSEIWTRYAEKAPPCPGR